MRTVVTLAMRTPMRMGWRTVVRLVLALLLVLPPAGTVLVAASRCNPRVGTATRTIRTAEEAANYSNLLDRLDRLGQTSIDNYRKVAVDCLDVLDPNTTNVATVPKWIRIIVVTATTDEQALAVLKAANSLRYASGVLFAGIVTKTGYSDGSSSWINSAYQGNRGHLFEVVSAAYLIDTGVVLRENVVGMGIRLQRPDGTYLFEGDLVDQLPDGKRFIDFKARDGNYDTSKLDNIAEALREGWISEYAFAYERGTTPPADWVDRLNVINQALEARELKPITLIDGGPMP